LGGAGLTGGEAGRGLDNQGQPPRRLALLAVLAAAGDAGRNRDPLLLLFWPDATQSRARHSLEQMLYAIRSSLGEDVFEGVNPIRLNPSVISSDVAEFKRSADAGDLEAAVALYQGSFLDGFYLSDAPEFEQWCAAERLRLERTYVGILERLARKAEATGNAGVAVGWWRKLVDADPLSTKNATGMMRSLLNAGDHAAALLYADQYERLVARELGTGAGPEVAAIVADVRARTSPKPAARANPETLQTPAPHAGATIISPESSTLESTDAGARAQPRHQGLAKSWIPSLGAIVILIIAALVVKARSSEAPQPASQSSIVVLPFRNLSGRPEDAALVEGITEEMIGVLSKIPGLRVIARTSAFAMGNADIGEKAIADSLHVSNVLEGSVQKADSLLRVHVRLVDADDGSTRWSEQYDRESGDIFVVQSEIAQAVARELNLLLATPVLSRIQRGGTRSVAAYEFYLRGTDPALLRSDSGARAGREFFRQAIRLDSQYAAAYAGFVRMELRLSSGNDTMKVREEALARAKAAALKAVALDDSLGDAHAALSIVLRASYDFHAANRELERAIELDPGNSRLHEWMTQNYVWSDRPKEALAEANRALQLDPLSPTANAELANALAIAGRCDEALARLQKLKSLRPPLLRAAIIGARCYGIKRMWPEALAELERVQPNAGPGGRAAIGYMLARSGRRDEARRILDSFLDRRRGPTHGAFDIATIYAGLGEKDQAFAWLDSAFQQRSVRFENISIVGDALRGDPRLDSFRARLGLN
jgi:TolB-like protein/DNA-binding SARP family transcriptional activator